MNPNPNYRYRLKFEKLGNMRFIGHLDTLALFERCLTLTKLPVALSEGFNKRKQLAFAIPLGLGVASIAECLDIDFTQDLDPNLVLSSLNNHLPKGIHITATQLLPPNTKSAPRVAIAATYQTTSLADPSTIATNIQTFLNSTQVLVLKKTKSGETQTNIRPLVYDAHIQDNKIITTLSVGEKNLKPQVFVNYIAPQQPNISFTRIDILKQDTSGQLVPIWH